MLSQEGRSWRFIDSVSRLALLFKEGWVEARRGSSCQAAGRWVQSEGPEGLRARPRWKGRQRRAVRLVNVNL